MTIKMPRNLMTAISVVAFAVLLNGCGGGGGSSPVTTMDDDTTTTPDGDTPMAGPMIVGTTVPSGTTIDLPAGHDLPNITISAATDETIPVPGFGTFTCVSAGGCSATVAGDVLTSTGDIKVVSLDVTDTSVLTQLAAAVATDTDTDTPAVTPDPTALETVQADAVTAATAAATAATAAKTATETALAARENRAVIQTGDLSGSNSGASAHSAYMQAKAAADAATAAQTASDAAAAATDVGAATRALVMAEAARDNAVTAQGLAETHRDAAVMASTTELKIVEKVKTVGDTSIEVDKVAKSSTIGEVTRHTGLLDMDLSTSGVRDKYGRLVKPVNAAGEAVVVTRTAASTSIGVTYDDADDTARLTLITAYLGSQKQMQFVRVAQAADNPFLDNEDERGTDEVGGPVLKARAGDVLGELPVAPVDGAGGRVVDNAYTVELGEIKIDHDRDGATEDADAIINEEGEETSPAMTGPIDVAPKLAGDHFVDSSVETTTTATLYYVDTGKKDTSIGIDSDNDGTIEPLEKDDGIDQTKRFLERNVSDGETTYTPVAVIQVTIDNATAFKHIHYGLWNGLSGSGLNTIADLGTGFVTALSDGAGMTNPDHEAEGGMPNFGSATYNGNWVANVQAADNEGDGAISRQDGTSSMTADFVKDTVEVGLAGLATLDGTISENTFSGAGKPKLANALPGGLANTADFMGGFSGAFFGPSAAEAGGVFDYASKDNKNGAFRGSFGVDQE